MAEAWQVEAEVARRLVDGLHGQLGARAGLVAGIEVEVGEAHGLSAAALREALRGLLPGREVVVRTVPVLYRCEDCGSEFPADEHPCPVCGSARVALVHGEELGITRAWA